MSNPSLKPSDVVDASELSITEVRSGRAVSDERGNCSWEWQVQPGVYSRDIDTAQLKQLEARDLGLVDPAEVHETRSHSHGGRHRDWTGHHAKAARSPRRVK